MEHDEFNFDLERMKKAVESPSVELPEGLTFEEFEEFLKSVAESQ